MATLAEMMAAFQAQQAPLIQQAQQVPDWAANIAADAGTAMMKVDEVTKLHDNLAHHVVSLQTNTGARIASLEAEVGQLTQAVQLLLTTLQNGQGVQAQPPAATFRNVAPSIPTATAPQATAKREHQQQAVQGDDNPHGWTGHCQAVLDQATGSVCGKWCKYAAKLCPEHIHLHPDADVREKTYARVAKANEGQPAQAAGVKGGSVAAPVHPTQVHITPDQMAWLQQQRRDDTPPPAAAAVPTFTPPPVTPAPNAVSMEEMFAAFVANLQGGQQAQQQVPLTLPKRERKAHDTPNCDCGICAKVREKEMIPHPASYLAKHPDRAAHNQIIARKQQQQQAQPAQAQQTQAQQAPAASTPFPKAQYRKCPIDGITHTYDDGMGLDLCPVHHEEMKRSAHLLQP